MGFWAILCYFSTKYLPFDFLLALFERIPRWIIFTNEIATSAFKYNLNLYL